MHGFQAALVAWPAAVLFRRLPFAYVHRITKATGGGGAFRWLYAPFRVLAGVSRAVTASLSALAPPDRLVVLENGIDWRRFADQGRQAPQAADGEPVVVCVGRLLPHKGQALVIEAFETLLAARPGARLWIVGDGPQRESLEAMAHDRGVSGRVTFWGHRGDVYRFLAGATIFANGSRWEGMSNAVLEAMAMGMPSVVVDAPGVTECHVPGATGFVVDPSAGAMAARLLELAGDAGLRRRMGDAARERVRAHYSMEANRRRYLELYKRLTEAA